MWRQFEDQRFGLVRVWALVALLIPTLPCWLPAQQNHANQPNQLKVVIISVTEFDDQGWDNPRLALATRAVTNELATHFQKHFNVEPLVLTEREETTAARIRTLFLSELPSAKPGTIHVIFFLTHGEAKEYPDAYSSRDLFLITSDSPHEGYEGVAISGRQLITDLQRLPKRSSAFLFLDACHSGGIGSLGVQLEMSLTQNLGTRMMILAASLSDELSYQARFSQALVRLWVEDPGGACTHGEVDIPERLRTKMLEMMGNSASAGDLQNVQVVVPYPGQFCLESFAVHGALVLLDNYTESDLSARFENTADSRRSHGGNLKPQAVTPVILDRETYEVRVTRGTLVVSTTSLAMKDEPVRYVPVGVTRDISRRAVGYEQAAEIAERAGAELESIQELRLKALGSYRIALGQGISLMGTEPIEERAQGLEELIRRDGGLDEASLFALNNATRPPDEIKFQAEREGLDLGMVGIRLGQVGDPNTAWRLCSEALRKGGGQESKMALAECTYYNLAASGEVRQGLEVRNEHPEINEQCPECVPAERRARDNVGGVALGEWRALGAIKAMSLEVPTRGKLFEAPTPKP